MRKEILDALYEPFELKARPGQGGKIFKYVPSDDVVDRMNKVFDGNWSTEVVEREVIEDQILIRVRVYAQDPMVDDSPVYWQEGYASQPIARFTRGDRSGQIIDLGNSYKSAMSKAIKTAVARWGVGLYLEKDLENKNAGVGSWGMPDIPVSTPQTTSSTPSPVASPMAPPVTSPVMPPVDQPATSLKEAVATPINVPPDILSGSPSTPEGTLKTPSAGLPGHAPVFTDDNVVVTKAPTPDNFVPPVDSVPKSNTVENLTDVQKAAIDNIMVVHGKTFEELVAASLQRTDNVPTSVDSLSYPDAVKIIQYGNNLNTNL